MSAQRLQSSADARPVGLTYVSDCMPGIRKRRRAGRLRYTGPDGRTVHDPGDLARIRALAIPLPGPTS